MHLPECQYLLSGTVESQGSSDNLPSVGSYNGSDSYSYKDPEQQCVDKCPVKEHY